jgi:glycosyltransferase involved in cell wall biosynthesis
MEESDLLSNASFWVPAPPHRPSDWSFHVPFIFWLIDAMRPAVVVDLGQSPDVPYFTFCEAVQRASLTTRCFAIDTSTTANEVPGAMALMDVGSSFDALNTRFHRFSTRLKGPAARVPVAFADRSVDVLHIHGLHGREALSEALAAWAPLLSDRGIVLLSGINEKARDSPDRKFVELEGSHATFAFTHGNGLGLVATGKRPPACLERLMTSAHADPVRERARSLYARLGRELMDRLEQHDSLSSGQSAANGLELEAHRVAASPDVRRRKREREIIKTLSRENTALLRQKTELVDQLDDIRGSLAWVLIQRARDARAAVFKEGTRRARFWHLSSRFAKITLRSGARAAVRKALGKVARKLRLRGTTNDDAWRVFSPCGLLQGTGGGRFRELPWRFTGNSPHGESVRSGHFKLLLVAHSACRTGAPLCLLELVRQLSQIPDFDCYVVLQQGGELAESFARIAPTLDVSDLIADGVRRDDIPTLILSSFHEFSSRGIAVCNTVAVSGFHEACLHHKIAVLSWVHELPSFIDALGGSVAIDVITAASRKIVVPAEFVRRALIARFDLDPSLIKAIYNGQAAKTRGLSRTAMRVQVRSELGLPSDARIVLGCGTVDLRKGADLFVNVARKFLSDPLAKGLASKTWFLWVGHGDDDGFLRWLTHDTVIGDLEDRIRFVGARAETAPYFLAADVFALTSREDPCPLVNFEAMESGLAVVAFQDAGGAPEVLGGSGITVPYIDVEAMARSIVTLLTNRRLRTEMGARGQALIRDRFTWARFTDEILDVLRTDFQYRTAQKLRVSVIVPNYRHEGYLEERLRSIFRQTLKPYEIIVLDDASPDGSVAVAERVAADSPVPIKIVVNDQNSGSTFRQWTKGLDLATGDLIWLAESDDSCHPEFLERLVPEFYDPEVALGYCQSALIGPRGETLADNFLAHTDDLCPERWRFRYCALGTDEAERALSQKNTIPNASAVVFRRPVNLDFVDELVKLRFAGDWFFYAMLIRSGKIIYIPDVLNYYRRHEQTVTHQSIREEIHAIETLHVKALIFEAFGVTVNAMAASLARTVLEYQQLSERLNLQRPALTANAHLAPALDRIRMAWQAHPGDGDSMSVLLVLSDLKPGALTLANIHLASALAREHRVFLCILQPADCDQELIKQLDDRVAFLEGIPGPNPGTTADLRSNADRRAGVLAELIKLHRIDAIHWHARPEDPLALCLKQKVDLPWLVHVDGYRPLQDRRDADPDSLRSATELLAGANGLFYDHEADLHALEQHPLLNASRMFRTGSGFDWYLLRRSVEVPSREPSTTFRFFLITSENDADHEAQMASAAIETANSLFAERHVSLQVRLVLMARDQPAEENETQLFHDDGDDEIEVYRGPESPVAIMARCDAVIMLAASVTRESCSLAVAALAFGQPIITVDHGPPPDLIAHEGRHAGLLLPSDEASRTSVTELVMAVRQYGERPELYALHAKAARSLFESRYTVERVASVCAEAYAAAKNLLPFPEREMTEGVGTEESPTIPSRRLA